MSCSQAPISSWRLNFNIQWSTIFIWIYVKLLFLRSPWLHFKPNYGTQIGFPSPSTFTVNQLNFTLLHFARHCFARREGRSGWQRDCCDDDWTGNGHSGGDGQEAYRNAMRTGDKLEKAKAKAKAREIGEGYKLYSSGSQSGKNGVVIRCTRMAF